MVHGTSVEVCCVLHLVQALLGGWELWVVWCALLCVVCVYCNVWCFIQLVCLLFPFPPDSVPPPLGWAPAHPTQYVAPRWMSTDPSGVGYHHPHIVGQYQGVQCVCVCVSVCVWVCVCNVMGNSLPAALYLWHMQTILLTKPRHCLTQMYHHTPKAPLTETTSLIYHDPVYCFTTERHHPDGWPSSKVQGVMSSGWQHAGHVVVTTINDFLHGSGNFSFCWTTSDVPIRVMSVSQVHSWLFDTLGLCFSALGDIQLYVLILLLCMFPFQWLLVTVLTHSEQHLHVQRACTHTSTAIWVEISQGVTVLCIAISLYPSHMHTNPPHHTGPQSPSGIIARAHSPCDFCSSGLNSLRSKFWNCARTRKCRNKNVRPQGKVA